MGSDVHHVATVTVGAPALSPASAGVEVGRGAYFSGALFEALPLPSVHHLDHVFQNRGNDRISRTRLQLRPLPTLQACRKLSTVRESVQSRPRRSAPGIRYDLRQDAANFEN